MKRTEWFKREFPPISDNGIFPCILERLEGTAPRLKNKLENFKTDSPLTKNHKWSINKEVGHLLDLEPLWYERALQIIQDHENLMPADLTNRKTHEANHDEININVLVAQFAEARHQLLKVLREVSEFALFVLFGLLVVPSVRAGTDTIPDLTKLTRSGDWLRLPSGRVIWVEMQETYGVSDQDGFDSLGLESADRKVNPLSCVSHKFAGVVRKDAKTVPHLGEAKVFSTLENLVAWLPTDSLMKHHQPPISTKSDSKRVPEESRNVKIKRAFLLAAYRAEDNDFHVLISNRPKYDTTATLFSIELSGLPDSSRVSKRDYCKLINARCTFISQLGNIACGSTFIFRDAGLPVSVGGSLFFDIHHAGQIHGRKGLHPKSAWEIHPVTSFQWLD
ncbi:MAG: hypothetical protein ACKVU0_11720 [Saprospiraceae bacterium]